MCGIVAYVGPREAQEFLLEGLRRLEYRGYDSAGLATLIPFHSRGGMRTLAAICFGGVALSVYGLIKRKQSAVPAAADDALESAD